MSISRNESGDNADIDIGKCQLSGTQKKQFV